MNQNLMLEIHAHFEPRIVLILHPAACLQNLGPCSLPRAIIAVARRIRTIGVISAGPERNENVIQADNPRQVYPVKNRVIDDNSDTVVYAERARTDALDIVAGRNDYITTPPIPPPLPLDSSITHKQSPA